MTFLIFIFGSLLATAVLWILFQFIGAIINPRPVNRNKGTSHTITAHDIEQSQKPELTTSALVREFDFIDKDGKIRTKLANKETTKFIPKL